jgi:hypothetical protein
MVEGEIRYSLFTDDGYGLFLGCRVEQHGYVVSEQTDEDLYLSNGSLLPLGVQVGRLEGGRTMIKVIGISTQS